ncbi:MAG TPA: polyamine ABC transporter substrate-binding protein, partial [Acidimicrobiaceae bacterium]|nr:polyamine ABC transporter substrate-binding protein [Acidimicrobiaceae bacterium]
MKRLSRRSFLASSAASAALLGLPGCVGGGVAPEAVTSSGLVRVLNWTEYLDPELLPTIEAQIGDTIVYQE